MLCQFTETKPKKSNYVEGPLKCNVHPMLTPNAFLGHELLLVSVLSCRIVALEDFNDELRILLALSWGNVGVLQPLSPCWWHALYTNIHRVHQIDRCHHIPPIKNNRTRLLHHFVWKPTREVNANLTQR